jgi:hypothetical protein
MRNALTNFVVVLLIPVATLAEEVWQTLPEPPAMPTPVKTGMAPVNDIQMY